MTTNRCSRLAIAIALIAVAGVAAGVLTRSSDSNAATPPAPVSTEQKALLHRAEERLIKRCMITAGFRYDEQAPAPLSVDRRFPFVIDDVAWARANGYGRPAKKPRTAMSGYFAALSTERRELWDRALLGKGRQLSVELPGGLRLSASDQGCIADARRALYGEDDLPRWFTARRTSDKLIFAVYSEVRDDQRFAGAMKQWSGCIRRHGYPSDSPGQLRATVGERTRGSSTTAIRTAERDATVAEATCATTTDAGRTLRELEAEYLAKITADHRRELQELNALEQSAVPRASAVLGTP